MEIFNINIILLFSALAVISLIMAVNRGDYNGKEGNSIAAIITILIYLIVFYCLDKNSTFINFYHYILEHPSRIIIYLISYFFIGLAWSFYKWYLLVNREKQKALQAKRDENKSYYSRPKPGYYASTLTMWIAYWPFSAFWYIISDPFINIAKAIRNKFTNTYDKISMVLWEDVHENEKKE
jgi:hypothetical protein